MPFMAAEDTISPEDPGLDTTDSRQRAHERLLRAVPGDFVVRRGHPLPYGAVARRNGVNFSIFSHNATGVTRVIMACVRAHGRKETDLSGVLQQWTSSVRAPDR